MPNLDNPAGRLLYWLNQGQQYSSHPDPALNLWCQIFDLNSQSKEDRARCLARGVDMMVLAQRVKAAVDDLPQQFAADTHLYHFDQVETCLDQFTNLAGVGMNAMMGTMSEGGWQALRSLDALLSRNRPEAEVPLDKVDQYRSMVDELIAEVAADGELADDLRVVILRRLRLVREALDEALISGAAGLERAVDSLIGSTQREPDLWDRIAQTRWGPRIGKLYYALATGLAALAVIPVLMPPDADTGPPVVNNSVETTIEIDQSRSTTHLHKVDDVEAEDDVVDAEVVEEHDPDAPVRPALP